MDVSDAVVEIPRVGPQDLMNGLIERFDDVRDRLEAAVKGAGGKCQDSEPGLAVGESLC